MKPIRSRCSVLALTAVLVASAAGLTACGGNGTASSTPSVTTEPGGRDLAGAEALEQEQFADISRGDRGAEWELMHPVDQALVSKARWIQCNGGRELHLRVKVLDASFVRANLPALGAVDAWQLKIDITGNIKETVETVYPVHAKGRWRFTLDKTGVDHIKHGDCP